VTVSKLLDDVKGPRLVFECATELMACEFLGCVLVFCRWNM
jgi:hypothetical protein